MIQENPAMQQNPRAPFDTVISLLVNLLEMIVWEAILVSVYIIPVCRGLPVKGNPEIIHLSSLFISHLSHILFTAIH